MTTPSSRSSEPDYFTTLETARILGLAVRSVQLMVDRGELAAWKTSGGHRRIAHSSVQKWLDERPSQSRHEQTKVNPQNLTGRKKTKPSGNTPVKATVLVIEDSIHYQNLVKLLINQQFPEVELHIANDGIAGLAMAGQLQPAVLIIDILLPGIDGATLITSLRSHKQFNQSQLIVMTSLEASQRAPYAFALTGLPVIHKPHLAAELPLYLTKALAQAKAEAPRTSAR
ncbi:MAG: response regulator [Gammaproteobacteria bacterium]|nr:response regulator [Gammaproteobacteria bacterium]MBU0787767.1 response regulator [Gammaproteobacteria bacterium]MBU0816210.1 response regulator [Gammaproteobacteria bacterium]MBU1786129.1 response regulator [Gammaproteobacteria bacterium]